MPNMFRVSTSQELTMVRTHHSKREYWFHAGDNGKRQEYAKLFEYEAIEGADKRKKV
jgi:hypothetical protein